MTVIKNIFTYLLFISIIITGCEDEPEPIPLPPSNLAASVVSPSQIDLSWIDNSTNEINFEIERKTAANDFQLIATLEKDLESFSDKGLSENTSYTYRVHAINSAGELSSNSNEVSITTIGIPILSTSTATEVSAFSATIGGNISVDGGSAITSRGVIWGTSPNPTIELITKTDDGSGTGGFTSNATELNWLTEYHVRAYATNATGTGYGNEVTFTTGQVTISTSSLSVIDYFSATAGGTIGEDGGYPISERGIVWSKDPNPTTSLTTKTIDGSGAGNFASALINLISNETYFVRAYAISIGGTAYGQEEEFTTNGLEDMDGNFYSVVQIGTQLWMSENLETTSYSDGSNIDLVTDNTAWSGLIAGAYCWWNNNKAINTGIHGALYNWYAVDTGNLCPTDWHVPSEADWNTLSNYLGGNSVSGGKMKATGTQYWSPPNTAATNESGFNGLPAGARVTGGGFSGIGSNVDWWSSTQKDAATAYPRDLQFDTGALNLEPNGTPKEFGFAVRCAKD